MDKANETLRFARPQCTQYAHNMPMLELFIFSGSNDACYTVSPIPYVDFF